jgi:hypothetical protein
MKLLPVLLLTLSFSTANASLLQCKPNDTELVKWAEALKKASSDGYNQGRSSQSDVFAAEILLSEAKLCSHQITVQEFCNEAVGPAKSATDLELRRYKGGLVPIDAVIKARTSQAEIEKVCSGNIQPL